MEEEEAEEIENGKLSPDQLPNQNNDPKKTSNEATLNGNGEQASREEEEVDENKLRLDAELLTPALEQFHQARYERDLRKDLMQQKKDKKSKDSKSTDKARDASREKKKDKMYWAQMTKILTESKHAVIVGRSHIVGSPMSILLGRNGKLGNATATLTHSKTPNLHEITRQADILVAAIGKPLFIRPKHVKHGAIVIDVGINRVDDKLVGDVDFERVEPIASAISPVPGGVGLMTRVGLLMNTLRAADGRG